MRNRKNLLSLMTIVSIVTLLGGCTTQTATLSDPIFNTQQIQAQTDVSLGLHYLVMQDPERAKSLLEQSLQEDPNIPSPWYSMGYYLENVGNRDKAETYYKKAIAVAPKAGETYNNYGTFLCRGGQYLACLKQFKLAIDTHYSDVATAYQNAGLALINMNKEYEAKYYLHSALEKNPKETTSMLQLARIYYDEGRPDQAKQYMNMYLKAGGKKVPEEQQIYNEVELNIKPKKSDLPDPGTTAIG